MSRMGRCLIIGRSSSFGSVLSESRSRHQQGVLTFGRAALCAWLLKLGRVGLVLRANCGMGGECCEVLRGVARCREMTTVSSQGDVRVL
jgi:hypothetical protein